MSMNDQRYVLRRKIGNRPWETVGKPSYDQNSLTRKLEDLAEGYVQAGYDEINVSRLGTHDLAKDGHFIRLGVYELEERYASSRR